MLKFSKEPSISYIGKPAHIGSNMGDQYGVHGEKRVKFSDQQPEKPIKTPPQAMPRKTKTENLVRSGKFCPVERSDQVGGVDAASGTEVTYIDDKIVESVTNIVVEGVDIDIG